MCAANTCRIGNAQAFWGDRGDAAKELLTRDRDIDFLTLDYLAEVSMSILASQQQKDPKAGYARDIVKVIRSLAPYWSSGGRCKLVTNAGGLNPYGAAEACQAALSKAGCHGLRIGVVSGDDILKLIKSDAGNESFRNLDSGADLSEVFDRLVTANAYMGAQAIVRCLADGADIVITGRVADPSMVVAPCMHHFGWLETDLDKLAGGTVAGHLIECGVQVTGGISTDWLSVPGVPHIGFPIVEISADGTCVVTKPAGTGGRVTEQTVKEQLLYEIGDPSRYLSPDVTVSFSELEVEQCGLDRVRVTGAVGTPPPPAYKVSATYREGYRADGTLTMFGRDAVRKARRCGEFVLQRVHEAGYELKDSMIECLGTGACVAEIMDTINRQHSETTPSLETVLRLAVESQDKHAVERFSLELMPFVTAGPQGTTGYSAGRPRIRTVYRYWPCLVNREKVRPVVEMIAGDGARAESSTKPDAAKLPESNGHGSDERGSTQVADNLTEPLLAVPPRSLYDLAYARSGDKGTGANIGIIARSSEAWKFLRDWLTAKRVEQFFSPMGIGSVQRYELNKLQALNFLVPGILQRSLRSDVQGKVLGQALLELSIPSDAWPDSRVT